MAETETATTTEGQVPPPATDDSLSKEAPEQEVATTETPAEATAETVEPTEAEAEVTYEFKAPEGYELDPEAAKAFEGIAREIKLAPGDAQKAIETMLPVLQDAQNEALKQQIESTHKQWEAELKADKDFGGEKLTKTLEAANTAIDGFTKAYPALGESLRQLLDTSGLGGNLAYAAFSAWVGEAMKPDTGLVRGKPGGSELPADPVARLAMTYDQTE